MSERISRIEDNFEENDTMVKENGKSKNSRHKISTKSETL